MGWGRRANTGRFGSGSSSASSASFSGAFRLRSPSPLDELLRVCEAAFAMGVLLPSAFAFGLAFFLAFGLFWAGSSDPTHESLLSAMLDSRGTFQPSIQQGRAYKGSLKGHVSLRALVNLFFARNPHRLLSLTEERQIARLKSRLCAEITGKLAWLHSNTGSEIIRSTLSWHTDYIGKHLSGRQLIQKVTGKHSGTRLGQPEWNSQERPQRSHHPGLDTLCFGRLLLALPQQRTGQTLPQFTRTGCLL